MPIKKNREYRTMAAAVEATEHDNYIVKGYATTWEPYLLYEHDDMKLYERIDKNAFNNADMSDVIMQYDHAGRVYARQSNGTLKILPDEKGLYIEADLSSTNGSRELYEDIKAGLITKMSWAFNIDSSGEKYDKDTRTRTIIGVKKVFDVSAVSIPANNDTSIYARSFIDGVIEEEKKEFLKRKIQEFELESKINEIIKEQDNG